MSQDNKFVNFFKNIKWKDMVKPVIGYSVFGGAVALAVIIGVLVCCL